MERYVMRIGSLSLCITLQRLNDPLPSNSFQKDAQFSLWRNLYVRLSHSVKKKKSPTLYYVLILTTFNYMETN